MWRSLLTTKKRQNVLWVGDVRLYVWIFSEQVHSMNMERYQERLPLKEGSSLKPLKKGISLTSRLHHTRERLGSKRSSNLWIFTRNKK